AMGVLLALAREPGVTLSRDELLDQVWGSIHVTPGVVGHAITALRRAFGDDPAQPGYIETIPRVGYRLVAPVQVLAVTETGSAAPEATGDMAIASGPGAPPDGANAAAPLPAEPVPAAGARPEKLDVP